MEATRPQDNDEINLIEFIETVWDGKWKIVFIVALSVLGMLGFQLVAPSPSFIATTEIKPITSVEAGRYRASNTFGFFGVDQDLLQDLYIEQLDERTLFKEAIRKHKLLDRTAFETDSEYSEALVKLAASIVIQPPVDFDGIKKSENRQFWRVKFEYNDEVKWKNVLLTVNSNANKVVSTILQKRFLSLISIAKQKRDFKFEDVKTQIQNAMQDFNKQMEEVQLKQGFELEDLLTQIENAKKDFRIEMEKFELQQQFELEDIGTQIDNTLKDYDRKTTDRLAFLREQAAIARKLGVSKNTIEAQTFNVKSGIVANVKTDTPFYLRGYEAIEKEIELIESREDKEAFIDGLFELEQKKRALEQDKTLQRAEKRRVFSDTLMALDRKQRALQQDKTLERAERRKEFLATLLTLKREKRALQEDKTLERAERLFSATPVVVNEDFSAVSITIAATEFEYGIKRIHTLILVVMIGGMVGLVYVLIANAVRKRKQQALVA